MPNLRASVAPPLRPRAGRLAALEDGAFDVLVIGGGITGCGIARDAALRGLRVALVELADFGSGTSSRSSRLIHGGVRYLEHGHLRLVFEASAERRRLLALAPHLVRPLQFTWPVHRGARVPRWKLAAGLALYDALALFRNVGRHERLGAGGILAREPRLRADTLVGGATYFDAATDDSRLTLLNAIDAAEAGAVVASYVRVTRADGGEGRGATTAGNDGATAGTTDAAVTTVEATDVLENRRFSITARAVVSAVGPWASGAVRGSTGVHVQVPRDRVGNVGAVTLVAPQDGRVMFVLPAGTHTIIGTTETPTVSAPGEVRATEADVRYLLDAVNHHFPAASLTRDDVVSAWAGIRPLVAGSGSLGGASREHHVAVDGRRVSVTGGKLTTYRVMADDAMRAVLPLLGMRYTTSPTASRPLPGGDLGDVEKEVARAVRETGLEADVAGRMVTAYGSRWQHLWATARSMPGGMSRLLPGLPYLAAEAAYAAQHEMTVTIADFLIRRTHIAFETRDHGWRIAPRVAEILAPILGWSPDRQREELARCEGDLERMFGIDG